MGFSLEGLSKRIWGWVSGLRTWSLGPGFRVRLFIEVAPFGFFHITMGIRGVLDQPLALRPHGSHRLVLSVFVWMMVP